MRQFKATTCVPCSDFSEYGPQIPVRVSAPEEFGAGSRLYLKGAFHDAKIDYQRTLIKFGDNQGSIVLQLTLDPEAGTLVAESSQNPVSETIKQIKIGS